MIQITFLKRNTPAIKAAGRRSRLPRIPRLTSVLLSLFIVGCATNSHQRAKPPAIDDAAGHPVWDVSAQRFISIEELGKRAAKSDFVLLGETHDNPHHHMLQARIIRAVSAHGELQAVAFEQIPASLQAKVQAATSGSQSVTAVAEAVEWEKSGWPAFAIYSPVFTAASEAGASLIAADLPASLLKKLRKEGLEAFNEKERERLGLNIELSQIEKDELAAEIDDAHCGYANENMIKAMTAIQQARDAYLADRLMQGASGKTRVLIAGRGHVQERRGAPLYIERRRPTAEITTVGILERKNGEAPTDSSTPFDYVLATEPFERDDPCKGLKTHLEKMKEHKK